MGDIQQTRFDCTTKLGNPVSSWSTREMSHGQKDPLQCIMQLYVQSVWFRESANIQQRPTERTFLIKQDLEGWVNILWWFYVGLATSCLSSPSRLRSFKTRDYFYPCLSSTQQSHHSVTVGWVERMLWKSTFQADRTPWQKGRAEIAFFFFVKNLVASSWTVSVVQLQEAPLYSMKIHPLQGKEPLTPPLQGVQHSCPEYRHPCSQALSKGMV